MDQDNLLGLLRLLLLRLEVTSVSLRRLVYWAAIANFLIESRSDVS